MRKRKRKREARHVGRVGEGMERRKRRREGRTRGDASAVRSCEKGKELDAVGERARPNFVGAGRTKKKK
jgi:hypothetical protein